MQVGHSSGKSPSFAQGPSPTHKNAGNPLLYASNQPPPKPLKKKLDYIFINVTGDDFNANYKSKLELQLNLPLDPDSLRINKCQLSKSNLQHVSVLAPISFWSQKDNCELSFEASKLVHDYLQTITDQIK